MKIEAHILNSQNNHAVSLSTDGHAQSLQIAPRMSGYGSSANGGELLFLALATCYCNDIYREAGKLGIKVDEVAVHVEGDFGLPGEPASNVTYKAKVVADATEEQILNLMKLTDQVAEIQNTLRAQIPVKLVSLEAITR